MKNKTSRSELFLAIYPNSQLENISEAIAISGAEIAIENVAYDINGEFIPDSFTIYRKSADANIAGFCDAFAHIIGAYLPRGPIDTSKLPKTIMDSTSVELYGELTRSYSEVGITLCKNFRQRLDAILEMQNGGSSDK